MQQFEPNQQDGAIDVIEVDAEAGQTEVASAEAAASATSVDQTGSEAAEQAAPPTLLEKYGHLEVTGHDGMRVPLSRIVECAYYQNLPEAARNLAIKPLIRNALKEQMEKAKEEPREPEKKVRPVVDEAKAKPEKSVAEKAPPKPLPQPEVQAVTDPAHVVASPIDRTSVDVVPPAPDPVEIATVAREIPLEPADEVVEVALDRSDAIAGDEVAGADAATEAIARAAAEHLPEDEPQTDRVTAEVVDDAPTPPAAPAAQTVRGEVQAPQPAERELPPVTEVLEEIQIPAPDITDEITGVTIVDEAVDGDEVTDETTAEASLDAMAEEQDEWMLPWVDTDAIPPAGPLFELADAPEQQQVTDAKPQEIPAAVISIGEQAAALEPEAAEAAELLFDEILEKVRAFQLLKTELEGEAVVTTEGTEEGAEISAELSPADTLEIELAKQQRREDLTVTEAEIIILCAELCERLQIDPESDAAQALASWLMQADADRLMTLVEDGLEALAPPVDEGTHESILQYISSNLQDLKDMVSPLGALLGWSALNLYARQLVSN